MRKFIKIKVFFSWLSNRAPNSLRQPKFLPYMDVVVRKVVTACLHKTHKPYPLFHNKHPHIGELHQIHVLLEQIR